MVGLGFNYRLDEPRSALALSRLARLEADIDRRRALVRRYRRAARRTSPGVLVPYRDEDVAHLHLLRDAGDGATRHRSDAVRTLMRDQLGVQTSIFYPAVHEFTAYRERFPDISPAADRAGRPAARSRFRCSPHMTADEQDRVVAASRRRWGMSWRVPLSACRCRRRTCRPSLECLEDGWLTMGPRTQAFEQALAEYVRAAARGGRLERHGGAPPRLPRRRLGPGDEAIVPALTFVASANAAALRGRRAGSVRLARAARPNVDPAGVERRITTATRAIVAVHFCGYPADVEELAALCAERGLVLIEDCAQALGARTRDGAMTGTVGDAGCLSFFSKKQLRVGEGGAVVTNDAELAAKVRLAALARDDDRHLGSPSRARRLVRHRRHRLQLPARRAARGAGLSRLPGSRATSTAPARGARLPCRSRGRRARAPLDDDDVERSSHFAFPVLLRTASAGTRSARLAGSGVQTTWYPPRRGSRPSRAFGGRARGRGCRLAPLRAADVADDGRRRDRRGRRRGRGGARGVTVRPIASR